MISPLEARPYQKKAIDEIIADYSRGEKHLILQAPTGSGKTFIFSTIMKGCHEKGNSCLMVVRGKALVQQASVRLSEMGVPHGVFMGNNFDSNFSVQIISIDTARSRKVYPPAKMVIIDEAHYAVSPSFKEFLLHYEDAFWLGVTATPYPKQGLAHLANKIIYPITIEELFEQKFLCPPKYYAPNELNMSGVKLSGGEFNEVDSVNAFESNKIYGHVSTHWQRLCKGESSLCFAITLDHARNLVQTFIDAGARAVLVSAKTSLELRSEFIRQLESGELDVIVNVGTMTTGVDIPSLKNIILCRPTASKVLHTQILGRGTRIFPGKEYFKVIDHVGNIKRHGFMEDEVKGDLQPKKSTKKDTIPTRTCPECFAIMKIAERNCLECGYVFETKPKQEKDFIDTDLVELVVDKDKFKRKASQLWEEAQLKGWKVGAIYLRLKEQFGEDECRKRYMVYRGIQSEAERINYDASANRARYIANLRSSSYYTTLETDDWGD